MFQKKGICSIACVAVFYFLFAISCNNANEESSSGPSGLRTVDSTVTLPPDMDSGNTMSIPSVDTAPLSIGSTSGENDAQQYPRASIAYSYRNKMPLGVQKYIHVRVKLDKPLAVVEEELRGILNEPMADSSQTDSSIVKSIMVAGGKYFSITLNWDTAYFRIDTVSRSTQELKDEGNTWTWRVTGLKKIKESPILVLIKALGENGSEQQIDEQVLHLQVTVGEDEPVSQPGTPFFTKYKTVLLAIAAAGLVFLIYIFWRRSNLRRRYKVYFSYAWNEQEEKNCINKLYDSLKKDQFTVVRDKTDNHYKDGISDFMRQIGKGDFVIVAISDKYLKSIYCMFELYEVFRNAKQDKVEFTNRVFPIRVEEINLSDQEITRKYIHFWKEQKTRYEELLKNDANALTAKQLEEYQFVKKMVDDIGDLFSILADTLSLNVDQVCANDFIEMKKALLEAMQKKKDGTN